MKKRKKTYRHPPPSTTGQQKERIRILENSSQNRKQNYIGRSERAVNNQFDNVEESSLKPYEVLITCLVVTYGGSILAISEKVPTWLGVIGAILALICIATSIYFGWFLTKYLNAWKDQARIRENELWRASNDLNQLKKEHQDAYQQEAEKRTEEYKRELEESYRNEREKLKNEFNQERLELLQKMDKEYQDDISEYRTQEHNRFRELLKEKEQKIKKAEQQRYHKELLAEQRKLRDQLREVEESYRKKNQHMEDEQKKQTEQEKERVNEVVKRLKDATQENLEQYKSDMLKGFLDEIFSCDPEQEYSKSDIVEQMNFEKDLQHRKRMQEIDEKMIEIEKKSLEIKESRLEARDEIREERFQRKLEEAQTRDSISRLEMKTERGFVEQDKKFVHLEGGIKDFQLKVLEGFMKLETRMEGELQTIHVSIREVSTTITKQLNDTIHHFGKEVLRLDQNQMRVIETVKDELLARDRKIMELDISTKEKFLQMDQAHRGLIDRNREAIQAVGLQVHQVEKHINSEFLRIDRGLMAMSGLVEQYGNKVEAYRLETGTLKQQAEQTLLEAKKYGFAAEKLNAGSQQILHQAEDVVKQYVGQLDLTYKEIEAMKQQLLTQGGEVSLAQREAYLKLSESAVILERKQNEITNSMRQLEVSNDGAEAVARMIEDRINLAREKLEVSIQKEKELQRHRNEIEKKERQLEEERYKRRMSEAQRESEKERYKNEKQKTDLILYDERQKREIYERDLRYLEADNKGMRKLISKEIR